MTTFWLAATLVCVSPGALNASPADCPPPAAGTIQVLDQNVTGAASLAENALAFGAGALLATADAVPAAAVGSVVVAVAPAWVSLALGAASVSLAVAGVVSLYNNWGTLSETDRWGSMGALAGGVAGGGWAARWARMPGSLPQRAQLWFREEAMLRGLRATVTGVNAQGGTTNCVVCSVVSEQRARGDGAAVAAPVGIERSWRTVMTQPFGLRPADIQNVRNPYELIAALQRQPNGSRFLVGVGYKTSNDAAPIGHALNAIVNNGRVYFFDGQSGEAYRAAIFAQRYSGYNDVNFLRVQ